jgi:uncharacterized protein YfdQ (DUF2303 family)
MAPKNETVPVSHHRHQEAPHIVAEAAYTDPKTGAVYIHQDLIQTVEPWAIEQHIGPLAEVQRFGDIESWVAYVHRFSAVGAGEYAPLLTWSERGLAAVLDYHGQDGTPNRCDWRAEHPFERTKPWTAWAQLADGRARSQRDVVEALEDMADDIVEPTSGELLTLLRTLKGTSKAEGTAELRPDGTTSITYAKTTTVQTGGIDVPSFIKISVPVFKGHTVMADVLDANGKPTGTQRPAPVRYALTVRIRVDSDDGKVSFRLTRPQAETVFESALSDRIATTRELLGDDWSLLRATANG